MLGRIFTVFVGALALVLSASPLHARWYEAPSEHFVLYADTRGEDLREFGEMLERFHAAMELETGWKLPTPSPSNRLTVYMVGSYDDLRMLHSGSRNSRVGGFYIPRAEGSVAFVPNIRISNEGTDFAQTVLLHEYAHHFLISASRNAMPRWFSEGAAEYFASSRFNPDGSVYLGWPNNDRAYEISQAAEVSLAELLDYELYRENRKGSRRYDAFYGRSWLLFHYLGMNRERSGQLEAYWQAVSSGLESTEAAEQVFGDLDQLENELSRYGRQRNMKAIRFTADQISIGPVSLREISEGHAAAMPVILKAKRGVSSDDAPDVVAEARAIVAEHPGDPWALSALAEAEYDAGNDAEAIAAADRALAIDPDHKSALVQKGKAQFRAAEDAENVTAAVQAAMKPFQRLNKLEADHTQPLIHYYRAYTVRGVKPPEPARHALERALQLAPFDHGLAMQTAVSLASEGKIDLARYVLGPVAANPHGGRLAGQATAFDDALANVPEGRPVSFSSIVTEESEPDADSDQDNDS
ncbi:DUF1570 domain-containing protein [Altererythrobacter lutimaris]|uniref:DUF1570 domain-containing protein n=1 Tax=Altererythrobacter lutimaris TaxID=2743979 RepID=A0A850HHM1_9SPHN|nr:DUF1570 domain-containing protein [Altererythrobacter lutimaris]NVE94632.1 DUF1570 domain-containing protein [Altererythrobacter lutimaris]